MSDAIYIVGTDEYVVWEIDCTTPGFTFSSADWTAVAALVAIGDEFTDEEGAFADAVVETVDGKHYGKAWLIELLDPVKAGSYRSLTRLTNSKKGFETPLLKGVGLVILKDP